MHIPLFRLLPVAVLAVLVFSGGCAGTMPLQSTYRSAAIEIDGSERDWYEYLRPLERENMSMAVVNDDEFLFVSLLTSDPSLIGQIVTRGLVLWIDPAGGTEQAIGIQFPLGQANQPRGASPPRTREGMETQFAASLLEMEFLRDAGEERVRIPTNAMVGVATSATLQSGTLFYEARIPLRQGGPYNFAAETSPGATVGLGLESAELSADVRRQRMLEGAANSPMQGGGSYGGYYGGTSPPPGVLRNDESLSVWRKVLLARE